MRVRKYIIAFLLTLVFGGAVLAQPANKPSFHKSIREQLNESDFHFFGKKKPKSGLPKFRQQKHSAGFDHYKPPQTFKFHKKHPRKKFYKRKYTGKTKSFLGIKKPRFLKSVGGGHRSVRSHGKEDKRLFKAPAKHGPKHRKPK